MRPRSPRRTAAGLLLALCGCAAQASDTISGSVFGTRYDSYHWSGYGGSLGYQHASDLGGVIVTLNDTEYPVGSLKVVDLDAYRHEWDHVWISAGASIGDALIDGSPSSTLYKAHVAVDTQFDPRWVTHLADQFIDLDQVHGHLMTSGVEYRPTPRWGVNVAGGYALSGTLADRYGQLALNWYGVEHLYGGVVLGRTGYDPARLGEVGAVRREFQVYAGAALPLGSAPQHATLTLAADTLSVEGVARQTLRIGFIKPVRP
jgi:hypothetical protein